jgi:general secretion pathway protein C
MLSVFPDFLTRSRYALPLALLADLALAALALWLLVRLIWALWGATPQLAAGAPAPTSAAVAAPSTTPLASWHLFGNALPSLDPRRVARDAPQTGLKLVLHGVYASADPHVGRAIIGDEQGQERSYQSGDELPGGATLDQIYPDRVTLHRGAALEALSLPRDSASAAPAPRAAANLPGGAHPGSPPPFVNPMIAPAAAPDLARAGAALKRDPNELAREIQVLPVLENGKFAGVRLSGGKEAPLLAKLGLRPDDVITAVNGIALDSPARGTEIAASLQHAERARVTVRRNGQPVTLDVSTR